MSRAGARSAMEEPAPEKLNSTLEEAHEGSVLDHSNTGTTSKQTAWVTTGRGTWRHAGFHLATTIATPAAFAPLPSAVAALGWPAGVISLVMGTLVTSYCSLLLANLWDYNEPNRYVRYRDLGRAIYGRTGYWSVTVFQQIAAIGNNITIQIVAGLSMQAIFVTYNTSDPSRVTLQEFIIIFGAAQLVLSQLPDIHSLRWFNALCTFCTVAFTVVVMGLLIHAGQNKDGPTDYGVHGTPSNKVFRIFLALGTIAFSFGDAMLPEIQATIREPAKKNMYKGICLAYSVITTTYWLVAFLGYWAFGFAVQAYVVNSFSGPNWAITMANVFAVIQVAGCFQIYCRPTYQYFEFQLMNPKQHRWSLYNSLARLLVTSIYTALVTLIAAAMPFFGDFVALCGAIGFTPLDFIFPILAFLRVKKPKSRVFWAFNIGIVVLYTLVAILGAIGSIRYIVKDTVRYHFFQNQ
jgi:amino acid permease